MSKNDALKGDFNDKLWLKSYPKGIKWDMKFKGRALGDMFDNAVEKYADKTFINFMGKKYTFKQTEQIVNKLAAGMQAEGIKLGSKVAIALPNTPYYVFAYFAAQKLGATVVNLNPMYAEEEMVELCKDAQVDVLFTIDVKKLYPTIEKIRERAGIKKVVVCSLADALPTSKKYLLKAFNPVMKKLTSAKFDKNTVKFAKMLGNAKDLKTPAIWPDRDIAVYQYTGGTTGLPKAAMLTHSNVSINAEQLRMWFTTMREGQEKMLAVLPFFHVFAMTTEMNLALDNGHELVMMPEPDLKEMMRLIEKEKITLFAGVPKLYQEIIKMAESGKHDLSSLSTCIAGGAALDVTIKDAFEKLSGCTLVEGYGLSETSPIASANPLQGKNKAGTIGLAFPGTEIMLRDLDDPTKAVKQGEKGEICIRGPQVMKGYLNNPTATEEAIDKNGWFATGDIGVMDKSGYVKIVDRKKEMILTNNGLNVYPGKVEKAMMQHPNIEDVNVLGIDNDKNGQDIKAYIVLKDKTKEFTRDELKEFLKDKLSPYEMPRMLDFRDALPKTMIGKPDKKVLRAEEEAKAAKTKILESRNSPKP